MTEIKMKHMIRKSRIKYASGLGLSIIALFVSGCSSSPTPNFYSLSSKILPSVSPDQKIKMIEVLPVGLSDRLNRIPLVIQQENGQAKVLFDDRWTSTLSSELRDGISARLQQNLGAVDRYNSGMTGGQAAYRIAIDFANFDFIEKPNQQRFMLMNASWTIRFDDPNRPLTTASNSQTQAANRQISCRMSLYEPVQKKSSQLIDLVDTSQNVLDQLSQSIASSVQQLDLTKVQPISGVTCS